MSFLTRDKEVLDLLESKFISTGYLFENVSSNGGQVSVVVENDNGVPVYVTNIVVRSSFSGRIEKGFNPGITSEAANLELVNKKSGGSVRNEAVNVFSAGEGQPGGIDSSSATNFNDKRVLAGSATSPGAESEIGGNIIAPGDKMYVRVVNTSSNARPVSIDVDYIRLENRL